MLRQTIIFIIGLLAITLPGFATGFLVTHYEERQGLPNELTRHVIQDAQGFIWLASDTSLLKFNGLAFSKVPLPEPSAPIRQLIKKKDEKLLMIAGLDILEITPRLGKDLVRVLVAGRELQGETGNWNPTQVFEDRNEVLWISSNNSVFHFQEGVGFKSIPFPSDEDTLQTVFTLTQTASGKIITFSNTGKVFELEENNTSPRFLGDIGPRTGRVECVEIYQNETVILGTETGLYFYDLEGSNSENKLLPANGPTDISSVAKYQSDTLFAGTLNSGLWMWKPGGMQKITDFDRTIIHSVHVAERHHIWIGTDDGFSLLQPTLFRSGLEGEIRDILVGLDGSILTAQDNQIVRVTPSTSGDREETLFESDSYEILSMAYQSTQYWLGCSDGHLRQWYRGEMVEDIDLSSYGGGITFLFSDHTGDLWICQENNSGLLNLDSSKNVRLYGPDRGLSSTPHVLHKDVNNNLYVGSTGIRSFLFRYRTDTDEFENVSLDLGTSINQPLTVHDIASDATDTLWLGTSNGLYQWNANKIQPLHNEFLKLNKAVENVRITPEGELWFTCSKGLIKRTQNGEWVFDDKNGLPSRKVTPRTLEFMDGGGVCVGTVHGLAYAPVVSDPELTMTPMIISREIMGAKNYIDPLPASYPQGSFIRIEFVAPDFPIYQTQYQVRILGFNSNYIVPTERCAHEIHGIPPGDYVFEVRAMKRGHYEWSSPALFEFSIYKPWHESILSWFIIGLGTCVVIYSGVRFQTKRLAKEKKQLEYLVHSRTMEINAQKDQIESQNSFIQERNTELETSNLKLSQAHERSEKINETLNKTNNELELAIEKTRQFARQAEEANKAKSEFLTLLSHEIRVPINGIIGFTEMLLDSNLNKIQRDHTQTIHQSCQSLLILINDLLDFTRIQAGKMNVQSVIFNARVVCEEAMDLLVARAEEKGITMGIDVHPLTCCHVQGDPQRFKQVVLNLLSNAIKFTDKGSILIQARPMKEKGLTRFAVSDTGIGMDEEHQKVLFNRDSHNYGHSNSKFSGMGLGLILSRNLIEMMGGELGVISHKDKGSLFWFTLLPVSPKGEVESFQSPDPGKLLLACLNPIHLQLIQQHAAIHQWQTSVATTPEGLLQTLLHAASENNPFRMVIMEKNLAGFSGLQMSRIIREDPVLNRTGILLIIDKKFRPPTYFPFDSFKLQSLSTPLLKPAELERGIMEVLKQSIQVPLGNPVTSHSSKFESTEQSSSDKSNLPDAVHPILLAEDNSVNQRLIHAFLEKMGYSCETVFNGVEVIQRCSERPYSLILMDCQMPDMDGFEATKQLRSTGGINALTPIIAITANARDVDRQKCLDSGMNDYISKPIQFQGLKTSILKWLHCERPLDRSEERKEL